ncbi:MAG: proline dehydrogenase family protein [Acidimicrobiia bacterium]
MTAFSRTVLAVTEHPYVRRLFTELGLGRMLAERFVAGEQLDDAIEVARTLNSQEIMVSLDHLGEHVHSAETAERAAADYLACLDRIGAEGLEANISVKLTQLGLGIDEELCRKHVDRLAERAAEVGATVSIDMEDSVHTHDTLSIYRDSQEQHGNLGVAIQAYLHRTEDDLRGLLSLGGHIRLCKGAYLESPDIAYQSRGAVSSSFRDLLETLMATGGTKPAIATHDEELITLTMEHAGRRSEPYEFQMLYGVRTDRQRELVAAGYPLRVYIPYGSEWYAYLTRRLAERPANLLFFSRAVIGS